MHTFAIQDIVTIEAPDGYTQTAEVIDAQSHHLVLDFSVPSISASGDAQYTFELGTDGLWYDVNDSQTGIKIYLVEEDPDFV